MSSSKTSSYTQSILVVDRYKAMVVAIRNVLNQMGYRNIVTASDGSQALQILRENKNKFSLVISDSHMEPMTGMQLLREVRANGEMKDLPFLMTTSDPGVDNIMEAKRAGVSSMIIKPFSSKTLRERVESLLGEEFELRRVG